MYKSIHKWTKNDVAIKIIEKTKLDEVETGFLNTELAIIKVLEHPHVVELIDVYEDVNRICIVTELIDGGEMFNYLVDRVFISEEEAALIIYQMLATLNYIHECGIIHWDVKPENVLLEMTEDGKRVKNIWITDFGLSKMLGPNEKCYEMCGTFAYVAPEILM